MGWHASSWRVFDALLAASAPQADPGWAELDGLEAAAAVAIEPELARALGLCRRWNELAGGLIGSPSDVDWTTFRPLRLSREEDWSDWLTFLLEGGPDSLARDFLGVPGPVVKASREYEAGAYRADMVLNLADGPVSIEVKLDDPNLAKTHACCTALERTIAGAWRHFIVLPKERGDEWAQLVRQRSYGDGPYVQARTWTDLAVALRRCLRRQEGTVAWRSWALAYCGAVEQRVMGLPSSLELRAGCSFSQLGRVARLCDHLTAVMELCDGDAR